MPSSITRWESRQRQQACPGLLGPSLHLCIKDSKKVTYHLQITSPTHCFQAVDDTVPEMKQQPPLTDAASHTLRAHSTAAPFLSFYSYPPTLGVSWSYPGGLPPALGSQCSVGREPNCQVFGVRDELEFWCLRCV